MKYITYNGETHTFTEWCEILRSQPVSTNTIHGDDIPRFVQALDFGSGGSFSNAALYNLYTMFTDNPVSKQVFEKRVVAAFRKYRPNIERYRTHFERGWRISH